jgi:hypothetical protein
MSVQKEIINFYIESRFRFLVYRQESEASYVSRVSKHSTLLRCYLSSKSFLLLNYLKVHKNENFFSFDFEFCTISLLVMHK